MTDVHPPVLAYRTAGPRPRLRARIIRGAMVTSAVLVFLTGVALLLHPLVAISEVQESFGGGTIGTPASPVRADADDAHGVSTRWGLEPAQRQYLPRAAGYHVIDLITQ